VPQQTVPFVDRDELLDQLNLVLARAGSGAGSVVLIYGEAGTGKTRLCEQVGHQHHDHGGRVLLGRAAPEESAIAFAPVADALRAARRTEARLWEAVKAPADVLSMIVPELSTGTEVIKNRLADHPVLFEALLDAVEESARGDEATLWVLGQALQSGAYLYLTRRWTELDPLIRENIAEGLSNPASPPAFTSAGPLWRVT
jgi:hypothetical protein